MDEDKQKRPEVADADERKAADTFAEPPAGPGSVTAEDVARPSDREAVEATDKVVPGFTTTGPTGSQSGRSLYGMAPEDENPEGE